MFAPGLQSWESQRDRMQRSYERILKDTASSTEYEDDLQHFYQDCWHLKDWIKNDPNCNVGVLSEKEVGAQPILQVIADLANAGKHLVRHHDRVGAYATGKDVTVHLGQGKPADILFTITLSDGTVYEGKSLARQAMDSWATVLKNLGLG
jgi:hypothetical protein